MSLSLKVGHIHKVTFFGFREQFMDTSRYTQSSPVDYARVYYYLSVIFVLPPLFAMLESRRKGDTYILLLH